MKCPRCRGFVFDADRWYAQYRFLFRNIKHCLICGRNWEIEDGRIIEFPDKSKRQGA